MNILINWLLSAMVFFVGAYLLRGVHVDNFVTALAVAAVLGLFNLLFKPILIFLTLPITLLTLGLFTLVINALLILLAAKVVPGFEVDGFWWAFLYGIITSLLNSFAQSLNGKRL
jgi:putative membrane protein